MVARRRAFVLLAALLFACLLAVPSPQGAPSARLTTFQPPGLAWTNVTGSVGTPPLGRAYAAFACDTTDANAGTCLLTGGFSFPTGGYHSDTWTLKNGKWTNLSKLNPYGGADSIGLAWDPTDHEFVEMGATLPSGAFVGNYSTFNLTTGTWAAAANIAVLGTNTASNVGLAWDGTLGKVVTVGGQYNVNAGGHDYSEPWTFAFVGGTWTNVTTAVGTTWGGFIDPWVAANATVVGVYGGVAVTSGALGSSLAKTWTLGATWTAPTVTGPTPRGRAYEAGALVVPTTGVLFGGFNYSAGSILRTFNDTWTYNFPAATWTNVTSTLPTMPPSSAASVMAQNSTGMDYWALGQKISPTADFASTWTFTDEPSGGGAVAQSNPLVAILVLVLVGAFVVFLILGVRSTRGRR